MQDRLSFVYHTSKAPLSVPSSSEGESEGVIAVDAKAVAERVVESGPVDWVLSQV